MDDEKKTCENREPKAPVAGGGGCGIALAVTLLLGGLMVFYWREYTPLVLGCLLLAWWPLGLGAALGAAVLFSLWEKTRSPKKVVIAALALLLLPNLRWLASAAFFAVKAQTTLQEITETVEEPESLFIRDDVREDNFMPIPFGGPYGWNSRGGRVRDYLDGGLLKALAMQAPDGVVHLYRPGAEPFYAASDRCHREWRAMYKFEKEMEALAQKGRDDPSLQERAEKARKLLREKSQRCDEVRRADIEAIYNSAEKFEDSAALPPLRYRIHVWQKDRRVLFWRLYRVRQLDIYDNRNGRRIAWARAYYRDTWWFTDLNHAFKNAQLLWFGTVQWKFVRGPGVRNLKGFAEKVLFEKTKQRKQVEQTAGETAATPGPP